ncbi:hypothetical protein ACIQOU_16730 [Streptomyces sp. NPDC091279]|uniref:hypothetical protein n=1 Tax=Streptomyces sp. NPDC091279 TaxID=3365983 RepID=UPI00382D7204
MTTRPRHRFRLPRWLRRRRRCRPTGPPRTPFPRTGIPPLEPSLYRAEVRAEGPVHGTGENAQCVLASFQSISPKLVLRWLSGRALHLAERLDPTPARTPWVSPLMHSFRLPEPEGAAHLRAWASDTGELHAARAHIKSGYPLYVRFTDADGCIYTLTAWPLAFHPTNSPAQQGRSTPAPVPVRHRVGGLAHPLYVLAAQDPWT